ncbi:Six-hairpin glycosidase-like protein [Dyella telluris]|uniref:Six-hairpin glycosidase-like protein n=2 Tax=Dyella telluris TaxID=2763498 RepID=A0A7G8Q872_9GAMM|nr:Six-hairpin glycosidase-like protein [Dyella telluris]QNK02980.1 Six-hairpin glycosidase-like protein [Dyella telluris]
MSGGFSPRRRLALACVAVLFAGAVQADAITAQGTVNWQGKSASMSTQADGGFVLHAPAGDRAIPAQKLRVHTASPLFDGLFAMAQDDLSHDSVSAIKDGAYDHGKEIPCDCFATGEKWPYVWTRDLSYSIDLALWRIDANRARQSLRFKLSDVREPSAPQGLYVMQDTGSGGSWPISTDRVVWFLGAARLLDDQAFADDTWHALKDTLAQDRLYVFDGTLGLYRGETSFLDWREQTYPAWTEKDVRFIGESFALSTNVLHYQALQLAAKLAEQRHDASAKDFHAQAEALKQAINAHFWRADRGMYMSYIGPGAMPVDSYDLLGIALAVTSGVADPARAKQTLAHYPAWPAGSPVIWPERRDQPVYHNRAIWPFVSAYSLRAARVVNDAPRIAHEMDSILRGAALASSNMENYELVSQAVHVEEGKLSGPVVNSPRQLWSVAGYLDMVIGGVFGVGDDGRVDPKLPVSWLAPLFGDTQKISLDLAGQRISLVRPAKVDGDLLVAQSQHREGDETVVQLKAIRSGAAPLRLDAPLFGPDMPGAPAVADTPDGWKVSFDGKGVLYVDGRRIGAIDGSLTVPKGDTRQCFQLTRLGADGVESLPGMATCKGDESRLAGQGPWEWKAAKAGRFAVSFDYANDHGPINTGVTAAVKLLDVSCDGAAPQRVPVVMPHSVGLQRSSTATITAPAGALCRFRLDQGFNMSDLRHNAHYTGEQGGASGPVNDAAVQAMLVSPAPQGSSAP